MEITEEQYARIKGSLPVQRGNVSLTNLQVLNTILYVAEQGCKWRGTCTNVQRRAIPQRRGWFLPAHTGDVALWRTRAS